jgi:hypothetical protein
MRSAVPHPLAEAAFDKHHQAEPALEHYTGTVSLHALARLALITLAGGYTPETHHFDRGEKPLTALTRQRAAVMSES